MLKKSLDLLLGFAPNLAAKSPSCQHRTCCCRNTINNCRITLTTQKWLFSSPEVVYSSLALSGQYYFYVRLLGNFQFNRNSPEILFHSGSAMSVFYFHIVPLRKWWAELPTVFHQTQRSAAVLFWTHMSVIFYADGKQFFSPHVGEKKIFDCWFLPCIPMVRVSLPLRQTVKSCELWAKKKKDASHVLCDYCFIEFSNCCCNFGSPQTGIRALLYSSASSNTCERTAIICPRDLNTWVCRNLSLSSGHCIAILM